MKNVCSLLMLGYLLAGCRHEGQDANEAKTIERLQSGTRIQKEAALGAIGRGGLSSCLPLVRKAINDNDQAVGFMACKVLSEWKGTDKDQQENCEVLKQSLNNEREHVRSIAAWGLLRMNRHDKDAIGVLVALLTSHDEKIRDSARIGLEMSTNKRFGSMIPEQRDWGAISEEWAKWWSQNRDKFR